MRRLRVVRYWLVAGALFCPLAISAFAQTGGTKINVFAGRDARVGLYLDLRSDCTLGPLPTIRLLVAPAHGSIIIKRATLKATNIGRCLAIEMPALVVIYHPADNYDGIDEVTLEISWRRGHKQLRQVWLNVSSGQSKGQGI